MGLVEPCVCVGVGVGDVSGQSGMWGSWLLCCSVGGAHIRILFLFLFEAKHRTRPSMDLAHPADVESRAAAITVRTLQIPSHSRHPGPAIPEERLFLRETRRWYPRRAPRPAPASALHMRSVRGPARSDVRTPDHHACPSPLPRYASTRVGAPPDAPTDLDRSISLCLFLCTRSLHTENAPHTLP